MHCMRFWWSLNSDAWINKVTFAEFTQMQAVHHAVDARLRRVRTHLTARDGEWHYCALAVPEFPGSGEQPMTAWRILPAQQVQGG